MNSCLLEKNPLVKHFALMAKGRQGGGNNSKAETSNSHANSAATIPFKAWKCESQHWSYNY